MMGLGIFIPSLLWFYYPAEYILIANQDQGVFITTFRHFATFLNRPGGILEYAGHFLNQFLQFRLAGATLLAVITTSGYFVTTRLIARVSGEKKFLIPALLTPILMVGMHHYYPHQIYHSAGLILPIGMALLLPGEGLIRRIFLVAAVPALYMALGGFIWFFLLLLLVIELSVKHKIGLDLIILAIVYPVIIALAAARFIYLEPLKDQLINPLPFGPHYGTSVMPYLFVAWILLAAMLGRSTAGFKFMKPSWRIISEAVLSLAGTVLILHFTYHRKNAEFFQIEKFAIQEEWNGLLRYSAQHPSSNLFGSFYTNLALANTGALCSALFDFPQPFGRRGLCFPWEARGEILRRGSDFFWTIHFVNEAHHWAFESMIIDGFTRRNLSRLIQTELVRGNHTVAAKYIDLLGNTLFNGKLAGHYRGLLNDREEMEADPELGPRLSGGPEGDFFTDGIDLEKNLKLFLENYPSNRPAMDYLMALFLLEKDVEGIAAYLPQYMNLSEGRIPVLLDESLLVYMITHREENHMEMRVSQNTLGRFEDYTAILRQYRDQAEAARRLYPSFKNTFWFYLNFTPLPPK